MSKQLITEVLLPLVENKTKAQTDVADQPTDKYIGKIIDGKYKVIKLIGHGGYFTTYLVINDRDNKEWAMKVCDKKNSHYSPAMRDLILTEPYIMQKLDHPAIPKVIDIIEDNDNIYIVRAYIEGKTLETIVNNFGAQSFDKGNVVLNTYGLNTQNRPLCYPGTHFWIDPVNSIAAVYMKNSMYDGGSCAVTAANFEKDVFKSFN